MAGVARLAARGALLAAALAAAACVSKAGIVAQGFTIDGPPRAERPAGTRVLSLRPVYVAAVYSDTALVYRLGDHRIERDPYAYWAAAPGPMLTSAVLGYLREADFVRDVVIAGEGLPVQAAVEPSVSLFCGDFSNPAEAAGVLAVQFRVLAPASGTMPARELLLRAYTRRVPVSQRTAAEVASALNRALGEVMQAFLADLKAALPPA